ncbi:hypothetical protein AB4Z09_06000 [Rhodococcus sp. TAF43]|uniref:poly(ethylene terephthalate) hydrolase family protein n=1 Tax=unclassified Rhodococcus (in: high G+C Gram-positive bacteria) TaxID=192944 RepID=UPI000E0B32A3|nr:hypothetical protein [Rhodococcus sp. AG1013]RDI25815.1 hypothetical protein DEU38_109159 [Rhodococcus sp. AG1013]
MVVIEMVVIKMVVISHHRRKALMRHTVARMLGTGLTAAALVLTPALAAPFAAASGTGSLGLTPMGVVPASESAIQQQFGVAGPHPVTQTRNPQDCAGLTELYVRVVRLGFDVQDEMKCFGTFPDSGLGSPVGVEFYYPDDIAELGAVPLVLWTPGILVEPGIYDSTARHLASHGYVVAVNYSLVNWFGLTHEMGAQAAAAANADEAGPLYGHIDLTRTVVAGHSAGGGSALISGGRLQEVGTQFDPDFRVVGALAVEPGPATLGIGVPPSTVPTLIVTGSADFIVHPAGWPSLVQYPQVQAPAWLTTVRGASHGKPMDGPANSVFPALEVAFLDYVTKDSAAAKEIFLGTDYALATDGALVNTERNTQADALR